MIPPRPILDYPPDGYPEDEPTRDEDWAHEEAECEYKWERMTEEKWL